MTYRFRYVKSGEVRLSRHSPPQAGGGTDPIRRDGAAALPNNGVRHRHHPALPYAEVAGAIGAVRASGAYPATVLAFEFLVLTACRSGEVRGAWWKEVDLAGREWRIPGARMKTGREHRVPLSNGALAVPQEAQALADGSGVVFPLGGRWPAQRGGDREGGAGSRDRSGASRVPFELP